MVVLSASVCSADGKVLVARQFVSMTRLRIEGLLSAFPKLLGSEDAARSKQHTFVETDEVRYVYQPLDSLYILLVTNKSSNILKDLQTLRLLAKLVPEYCQGHGEEEVIENAFDLIFAFDEAVSLGVKEEVDTSQIKTFTTMESHEEKLTNIIRDSKIQEAKHLAKQNEERIAKQNIDKGTLSGMGNGMGSGLGSGMNMGSMSGMGDFGSSASYQHNAPDREDSPEQQPKRTRKKKAKNENRMQLGSKKTGNRNKMSLFGDELAAEEEEIMGAFKATRKQKYAPDEEMIVSSGEPVIVALQEKCNIMCEREGTMTKFDVEGTLSLTVTDPDWCKIRIQTGKPTISQNVKFRLKPTLDSKAWKKGVVQMKDQSEGFPVGSRAQKALLRWKIRIKDEDMCPIQVNFWADDEHGETVVQCDYSIGDLPDDMVLENVCLSIPGVNDKPEVSNCDGDSHWDRGDNELQWNIGTVRGGDTGNLEFTIEEAESEDVFYPISVNFSSSTLYSGISIVSVTSVGNDEEAEFVSKAECFASKFQID